MTWVIRFAHPEVDRYYERYTKKGPVFTFVPTQAYQFPSQEFAENVKRGDDRLSAGLIEEYDDAAYI